MGRKPGMGQINGAKTGGGRSKPLAGFHPMELWHWGRFSLKWICIRQESIWGKIRQPGIFPWNTLYLSSPLQQRPHLLICWFVVLVLCTVSNLSSVVILNWNSAMGKRKISLVIGCGAEYGKPILKYPWTCTNWCEWPLRGSKSCSVIMWRYGNISTQGFWDECT